MVKYSPEYAYLEKCELRLNELYENYSYVIEGWNNLLSQQTTERPATRRQLFRAYLRRAGSWDKVERDDLEKMITLAEENISDEPENEVNIQLWFQCARKLNSIDINTAIDRLATWRSSSLGFEGAYYLSILHTIQAIGHTSTSKQKAEALIEETSQRARNLPNRTYCYEWLGRASRLGALVSSRDAIKRNDDNQELVFNHDLLRPMVGKIATIKGPEVGTIELECGLKAFFIPARGEGFFAGKDNNSTTAMLPFLLDLAMTVLGLGT